MLNSVDHPNPIPPTPSAGMNPAYFPTSRSLFFWRLAGNIDKDYFRADDAWNSPEQMKWGLPSFRQMPVPGKLATVRKR